MKEYELVERSTGNVIKTGNYWSVVNECIERGTHLYYTRIKWEN